MFFLQATGASKQLKEAKTRLKHERMQSVSCPTNVTPTSSRPPLNRNWRDEGLITSSTDVAAARVTLTPASKNGSFDRDSGVSGGTTYRDDGQVSSPADIKSTTGTKPRGRGGGILARGQILLKHLARRTDNNRPGK